MARAVTLDLFRIAAVGLDDLQPDHLPQLIEIEWSGEVVDVVTRDGIGRAGFSADYPEDVSLEDTQTAAEEWHARGAQGVCCRSASAYRRGRTTWEGEHSGFGEVAVYTDNADRAPRSLARRDDLDWLRGPHALEPE